ncbi:MAG: SCO family protein [Pirellulaceae bacterium]
MTSKVGIFFTAVLLLFLGGLMIWSTLRSRAEREPSDAHDITPKATALNREVPPFELTDSAGEMFDTAELDGDVWVASFFFTTCPSTCRLLNQQVAVLQKDWAEKGVKFISITCDPETDTPEVMAAYAEAFDAKPESWKFLTGDLDKIQSIANDNFQVGFAKQTHSDRILVVDREGVMRGTYRATVDDEFAAAQKLIAKLVDQPAAKTAQAETEPVHTGDAVAGGAVGEEQTMTSFELTDSYSRPFSSEQMKGNYWLGSFFFVACPSVCVLQNIEVARLQQGYEERGLRFVSISCDPENDTPGAMLGYAERFGAKKDIWHFCTGEFDYIQKIGHEFFNIELERKYHSDRVFLVDPEGKVLDSYRTRDEAQMKKLTARLEGLLPPAKEEESPESEPETEEESATEEVAS